MVSVGFIVADMSALDKMMRGACIMHVLHLLILVFMAAALSTLITHTSACAFVCAQVV